ncbi:MAG: CPBP family intramembrane metalloprotease [Spirulinaceae cyanobacterium RM2_2_10]|nr:CPBP family intramembrane metalloprotease [Spirulinaceae cyanobacterium SM2_1_0]NJO19503.1 CPBP family intramembrane metalloprotease [Spirulinaceae cyanobacterium RM2_2_10]
MTNLKQPEVEPLTRTQVLVAMAVTSAILLAIAKGWQQLGSVRLLPLEVSPTALGLGLGLAALIIASSSTIYRLWPAYRRSADVYLELVLRPLLWPDVIWLGLLPGLSEELLFRGVMLPALGLDVLAIALSSLLFGVLHLSGLQQWPYVVWATLVGTVLGFSALLTGNLVVPVVAHIVTNCASGCLWKWSQRQA